MLPPVPRPRAPTHRAPSQPRPLAPPPDAAGLREAALAHLARYATTEARLRQVLARRLDRWAHAAAATLDPADIAAALAAARPAIPAVVATLAAAGALNDADFAATRARALRRAGRSRRAIAATLAAKGVPAETARAALPDEAGSELAAALLLARRRRLGPFRAAPLPPDAPSGDAPAGDASAAARREQGVLARAGFAQDVVHRALACARPEAEALIAALRADA
ncbi:MAG: hypothetical protein HIU82_13140 [Proteobacteria bacterium]|nr:hypothetical protein [Pseudomonadota bacterium]